MRIKPGKPLWFGRRGRTLVFGLPGNPLSAIVGTAVFVIPALRRLRGETDVGPRFERGRLGEPAGPSDNRTTFLISKLVRAADGVLEAFPTERQGSHMTGALGESDGFAIAPHGSGPLPAGAEVDLLRRLTQGSRCGAQDAVREERASRRAPCGLLVVEVAARTSPRRPRSARAWRCRSASTALRP